MARQQGILKFQGKIGSFSSTKQQDGFQAAKKRYPTGLPALVVLWVGMCVGSPTSTSQTCLQMRT